MTSWINFSGNLTTWIREFRGRQTQLSCFFQGTEPRLIPCPWGDCVEPEFPFCLRRGRDGEWPQTPYLSWSKVRGQNMNMKVRGQNMR